METPRLDESTTEHRQQFHQSQINELAAEGKFYRPPYMDALDRARTVADSIVFGRYQGIGVMRGPIHNPNEAELMVRLDKQIEDLIKAYAVFHSPTSET
jgi:hypothetical protein